MAKRIREYNHLCVCVQCESSFSASRFDALYCSTRCRVAAKRAADRARVAASRFLDKITEALNEYEAATGCGGARRADVYYPLINAVKMIGWRSGYPILRSGVLAWWICTQCGTKARFEGLPDPTTHTHCACGLNSWKLLDTK